MNPTGFPHSEISGSKHVNNSPELIAAYHVLHRLPMPRHPPLALTSLSKKNMIKLSYCNLQIGDIDTVVITTGVSSQIQRILYYSTIQLSKIVFYRT